MKADLHLHTCYSPDSRSSLDSIVRRCRQQGIDCLAITDHNTIEGALRLQEISPYPIIVGEEIMTRAGEIIGYFLNRAVPRGLPPDETVALIKDQGGLVCLPHPFAHFGRHPLKPEFRDALAGRIDIIEVYNARSFFGNFSRKAEAFARQHGLVMSAGSDAHSPWEIGKAYVEMRRFEGAQDFKSALREAKIVGRRNGIVRHLLTTAGTLPKKLGIAGNV